jgi:hypothetical protein
MSKKRNVPLSLTSPRGESSPKPKRKDEGRKKGPSRNARAEVLALVRSGVEGFILKNATIEEFLKSMRAVSEQEKAYAHQLTRPVFNRIVKAAMKKRNHGRPT